MMDPFDFVLLDSGDYVCTMWWSQSYRAWAAFAFYSSQQVIKGAPEYKLGGKRYWKLFLDKKRKKHDEYLIASFARLVIHEPVGGIMLALDQNVIEKVFSAKGMLRNLVNSQSSVAKEVLDLLDVNPENAGVTGSTLLGVNLTPDFDLVVYGAADGRAVAGRVRRLMANDRACLLPGYWGRPHHRRFKFAGVEICPRFPLPLQILSDFTAPSEVLKSVESTVVLVEDATWGHCSPALYFTKVGEGRDDFMHSAGIVPVISSECAHSMAFREGDQLLLRDVELRCAESKIFISIPIGAVDELRLNK